MVGKPRQGGGPGARLAPHGADLHRLRTLVGGGWLLLSRLGANPLGFSDPIVLLTAVHFHHAGWSLPIITGLAGRHAGGRTAGWAAGGVVAGVALTALGINIGGWPEWFGAVFLAAAGLVAALVLLRAGASVGPPAAAILLGVAAGSLAMAMLLAAGWASAVRLGLSYLSLSGMAATHGTLNAVGFGLAGLIGWTYGDRPQADS